jgi:hypothetical protein
MNRPDQNTPETPTPNRSNDASIDLHDDQLEEAGGTGTGVSTPEPEEPRQGEAGNTYTGRQMSDALKDNPRVEDADRVTKE